MPFDTTHRPHGTIQSPSILPVDIYAILTCLLLLRLAFAPPTSPRDDSNASIHLAFYTPTNHAVVVARPSPMDMDGDGVVDALVVPSLEEGFRILRLPSSSLHDEANGPVALSTLFRPRAKEEVDVVPPVQFLSVHIPIRRSALGDEERSRQRHKKLDTTIGYGTTVDRTRHYFCGNDWHHASQVCHRHCPGGTSTECNDGESCYADTPCDAMLPMDSRVSSSTNETNMALTVRGTLPGIVTVWSDGSVTLHVITADVVTTNASSEHRGKKERSRKKKTTELELRLLWRVVPFDSTSNSQEMIHFEELGLTYESAVMYGTSQQGGSHGAIVLGGRYSQSSSKVSFHALDAWTGESLWDLDQSHGGSSRKKNIPKEFVLPIIHTTSSARRRSHLPVTDTLDPQLDNENSFVDGDVMTSEECMAHFRHSLFDEANGALPHEYWGDHGSMTLGRFERVKKSPRKKPRSRNKQSLLNPKDSLAGRGRDTTQSVGKHDGRVVNHWQADLFHRAIPRRLIHQQNYYANHPKTGKPNVVVFHGRDGLAVISLKNGRPVCHVSLVDNTLYADIDKDGVVDVIQVVTSGDDSHSKTVQSLSKRMNKSASEEGTQTGNKNEPMVCHALVTSGLPPKEEIFTAPLCLGGSLSSVNRGLHSAPPLLVEGSLGYGYDVVFAMNNGVVVRYDANGREVWRKKSAKDGTPSWTDTALLGRVQFGIIKSHSSVSASSHHNKHVPGSPGRPILLSGEEGAAVISPASGKVLSYVTYPQPAIMQPLLTDLNGDGTDDLLVVSKDAIWGYYIVVETDRSGFYSIVVVTLVVGVALSALIHKTSHFPRRSVDL